VRDPKPTVLETPFVVMVIIVLLLKVISVLIGMLLKIGVGVSICPEQLIIGFFMLSVLLIAFWIRISANC
jgi:hypothetical protein